LVQFFGVAVVGTMESYILNTIKEDGALIAKQIGILLDRNF
jgi:hypothetical protein